MSSDSDLTEFIDDVLGEGHLRVETDFGDGFVRLRSTEAQKRQAAQDIRSSEDIVIELLRNSRDAHARTIYLAVQREEDRRILVCIDDGDGIPEHMQKLVFEPRVTSKLDSSAMDKWGLHGRGMALYSINENSLDASVIASSVGKGTSIGVRTDLGSLGEKTDQSTFPTFEYRQGVYAMRGPKNILRSACEFALEHRHDCAVFVGSPSEIAATMFARASQEMTLTQKAFVTDISEYPLIRRLATCGTPAEFTETADGLGLSMSERTARRILDGQVDSLDDLLTRIEKESFSKESAPRSRRKGRSSSVRISETDMKDFAKNVENAFDGLAETYYLDPDVEAEVKISSSGLTVTIPLIRRP